jgi:gliding motility-associated-like protein
VPACDTVYTYALASIDHCGNKSPGTFSFPLSNIHLVDVSYNPCSREAVITFEPFIDLDADSIHFDLIGNATPGGLYTKLIKNEMINRDVDQYITVVDEDLKYGRTYDYFIRETVYKNGSYYTTSTCIRSIYAYNYNRPDHIYFANADVLTDNHVELTVDYDEDVKESYLEFWRTDPGEDTYNYLRTVYVDTLSGWPLIFTDMTADGSQGYYHYSIDVLDSCRHSWIESNKMKTIFLTVTVRDKNHNILRWNRFEKWDEHVGKYYIYRLEDEGSPWVPVDSVEWYADDYEFTDNISAISGEVERLVYWVQAVERAEDGFGFKEISNSNRVMITPESDIYFANAFKPGSELTPVFKPIFRFLGGTGYLFQIYNRWGQLIYETRDVAAGWDGTYKGAYVEKGTYIYKFQYTDGFGNAVNRQGTVTVIY